MYRKLCVTYISRWHIFPASCCYSTHYTQSIQDATLSQGVPCDAAVNFGRPTYRSFQWHWHRAVFTAVATLSN